jgi:hypothetical protein
MATLPGGYVQAKGNAETRLRVKGGRRAALRLTGRGEGLTAEPSPERRKEEGQRWDRRREGWATVLSQWIRHGC